MICPDFAKTLHKQMPIHGTYAKGWPKGAVVHYTAGRDGAVHSIQDGIKNGFTYWCIQRDGTLYCAHDADKWGYHAGKSLWQRLVRTVSDDLIGIEMNCAGILTQTPDGKFKTWYGEVIPASDVRYTPGRDNQKAGYYQKYTPAQEETLIKTLMWLKAQRPGFFDFDFVLGHDEVSGPKGIGYWRKTDPGASLSMTMTEFRATLRVAWDATRHILT